MKFFEALRQLKEGQMIVCPSSRLKHTPLEVRWEWGSSEPNQAVGYIPKNAELEIVDIPKPRVRLRDVLIEHFPTLFRADIDRLAKKIIRAPIDWDAEAEALEEGDR